MNVIACLAPLLGKADISVLKIAKPPSWTVWLFTFLNTFYFIQFAFFSWEILAINKLFPQYINPHHQVTVNIRVLRVIDETLNERELLED